MLPWVDGPVHPCIRLEALQFRVALERRQSEDASLAVLILRRLEHTDCAFHDRPTKRRPRRPRLDAPELPSPPPEARLQVIQYHMPGVSGSLGLDRGHRAGRQTELRRERGPAYLDRAHDIDRQLDGVFAGHRIGAVSVVEPQGALIAARAVDVQQAVRAAHYTRNERQRVL